MTNLVKFDGLCFKFNQAAGKLQELSKKNIEEQLALIQEELNETIADLKAGDKVGVLDGYTDLMVTVFGLGEILKSLGFKTEESLVATADNNDTKFIPGNKLSIVDQTLKMYADQGVQCKAEYNQQYDVFVIKDMNNKVRKPVGFVSNDLSIYVPEGVSL